MEIRTTKLTDNLYVLEGAGGNVAAFTSWRRHIAVTSRK
jgi:hypothetical protein